MKASPPIVAFNAGELSPRLDGRSDLDKYAKGCRTLQNFIPLVQGGAQKRSGFRFALEFGFVDGLLLPFKFSQSDSYILAFKSNQDLLFFRNGAPVFSTTKTITGATQANPVVVTATAHGFTAGQSVVISGVTGMTELNGRTFKVGTTTANTFALTDLNSANVNGTGYGAYVSGGVASLLYIINHPYSDLSELQFAGQNDVVYIASPSAPPQKLSRFGHANWTIGEVPVKHVPFSPENLDETSYVGSNNNFLFSNAGIFTASMVGSYVKLREVVESYNPEWKANTDLDGQGYKSFQADKTNWLAGDRLQFEGKVYECTRRLAGGKTGVSPPTHEIGIASDGEIDWKFINYGYGYAKIATFVSAFKVTVETPVVPFPLSCIMDQVGVSSMSTANPIVVTATASHGLLTGDQVFFSGITGTFGNAVNNTLQTITKLSATTFSIPVNGAGLAGGAGFLSGNGAFRMVAGAQPTATTGDIYQSLTRWSFAAWDAVRGYPRAVVFFEDRLIWAGTNENPQTCWASRTGRYEDHATFDEDDSALVFTLSAADPIEWMEEMNALVIGTAGAEFSSDRNATAPLAPGTVNTIRRRSQYGSESGVQPVSVENAILFAVRAGRKLRELTSSEEQGSFVAPDMTRLSDHITLAQIKGMAFQSEPNRILWSWLQDGQLLGFTYERDEQVTGWHRHPIGGTGAKVISAAVIPHPDGDGDQLWALVRRTVGAVTVYTIEYLEKEWTRDMALEDACFLDSAVTYDGTPATVISGLFRLAGETVWALADGVAVGPFTVSAAGKITLATAASVVQVGLLYSATLSPMRLEAGAADGTAQGKTKRISTVVVRLDQTGRGLFLGDTPTRATQEIVLPDGTLTDGDTALVPFPGRYDFGGLIALVHSRPTPATITAIWPQLATSDR